MSEREGIQSIVAVYQQQTDMKQEKPFTWEKDDPRVKLFPDEANTPTARQLAQNFLENHVYGLIWADVSRARAAPRHPEAPKLALVNYTPEWIKKQYEALTEGINTGPHAHDGDPLDPRFTLANAVAAARRQAFRAEYRKRFFNDAHLGRLGDVGALEFEAEVYRTIQGLIEQLTTPQEVGPGVSSSPPPQK
jgi:hypothetical protein